MLKNVSKIFVTTLLGKVLGFGKILFLVQLFGTNALTDAIIIVISIYWFWSSIFVYSLFLINLVPKFSMVKQTEAVRVTLNTIKGSNLLNFLIVAIIILFPGVIINLFASVDDPAFSKYAESMLVYCSPLIFLISYTESFTVLNQYNENMIRASINLSIWNAMQMIAIAGSYFYFYDNPELVVFFIAASLIVSYALTAVIQIHIYTRNANMKYYELFTVSFSSFVLSLRENVFLFLSTFFTQINAYVDNFFISKIGSGFITTYNIIIKLPDLAKSLFVSSIAVVFFNQIVKHKDAAFGILMRYSSGLLGVFSFGAIITYFLGVEVTKVIYGKEQLALVSDKAISAVLLISVFNVYLSIIIALLLKVFVLNKKSGFVLFIALTSAIINYTANYLLIEKYGMIGIVSSTSICLLFVVATYFIYMQRDKA